MTAKERLQKVIEWSGLTAAGFAQKIKPGIRSQWVYDILNEKISSSGKKIGISQSLAENIVAIFPMINKSFLIMDEGEMLNTKNSGVMVQEPGPGHPYNRKFEARTVPHEDFMEVPIITVKGFAGLSKAGFADPEYLETLDTMLLPKEYEKGTYAVAEVIGDSMNDGTQRALLEGDKYLIKQLPKENLKYRLLYKQYLFLLVLKVRGIQFVEIIDHDIESGIITCHKWNPTEGPDFKVNLFEDLIDIFYLKKLVERRINF